MVTNTNAPFGFRQFGQREGTAPTAGFERFSLLSSDPSPYFTGDIVDMSSKSLLAGNINQSGSSGSIQIISLGVFLGCKYYSPQVGRTVWNSYFPGNVSSSSPVEAYVCTNPEQLYIVQGSTGAIPGSSNIGAGIPSNTAGSSLGNTATGQSVGTVNSSLITALTSAANFRIVDVYSNYAPPGVNGTSTGAEGFQILVVQPNNFQRNRPGALALSGPST